MDSAFCNAAVIGAIRYGGARFSVTAPMNADIRAAIAAIPGDAWTPIRYPRDLGRPAGGLDLRRRGRRNRIHGVRVEERQAVTARLVVRRVRDLNQKAAGQEELFPVWRHHAVFTDSPFELIIQAEGQHRDHAVIEQVLADWTDGPLAHLPSGVFAANAAWLAVAAMAHNLLHAAAT
jgi:hypothetical protein